MERLSSLDEVFLAIENRHTPMNIGSVAIFHGSTPSLDEVSAFFSQRLTLTPRFRQRIREPRGWFGRAVWIDDLHFNLANHLHVISLADHNDQDFDDLVADLLATPLDRRRPLWRAWIVSRPQADQWVLVAMIHHCLADGIASNDLLTAILTEVPERNPAMRDTWCPTPEPTNSEYLLFNIGQAVKTARVRVRATIKVLTHPRRSWNRIRTTFGAAKKLWYRQPHIPTSLVGPIGPERCWRSLSIPMWDIRSIQSKFACTVNDVVIAGVTGGFRDLLMTRGEAIEGRAVTAMVPVSLRSRFESGSGGNRVANIHARLPIDNPDALSRLRSIQAQLSDLKKSNEVAATGFLMNIGEFVPRALADRIARGVVQRQRNVETTVTNVPGPRERLYFGPHPMVAGYPVAPIAGQVRITVAIWSYCDNLSIGITSDRGTSSDVDTLVSGIRRGFSELL